MITRRVVSRQPHAALPAPLSAADALAASPNQSDPLDPSDPGFGRPLGFTSDLAGFRHPQYLEGAPNRLPGVVRTPLPGFVNAPPGSALAGTPALPAPSAQSGIYDPHHYAQVNSTNVPVAQTAVQIPFLTQPATFRNLLALRNPNAVANIYIDCGQSASVLSTIKIAPGQTLLFDEVVPQDDLYAFADAAGATLSFAFSNIPRPI